MPLTLQPCRLPTRQSPSYWRAPANPPKGTGRAPTRPRPEPPLLWSEEAADVVAAARSLTELERIGPGPAKRVRSWIEDGIDVQEPPPVRRDFISFAGARARLAERPLRLRGDLQITPPTAMVVARFARWRRPERAEATTTWPSRITPRAYPWPEGSMKPRLRSSVGRSTQCPQHRGDALHRDRRRGGAGSWHSGGPDPQPARSRRGDRVGRDAPGVTDWHTCVRGGPYLLQLPKRVAHRRRFRGHL
jgi:hypothetical protein